MTINTDMLPRTTAVLPCADCGTTVTFRNYWNVTEGRYHTNSQGWCPECKANVRLRKDGTQATKLAISHCECGNPKTPQGKRCRECGLKILAAKLRKHHPYTTTCQYHACGKEFTSATMWRGKPQKYCTPACSRYEMKRRRRERETQNQPRKKLKRNESLAIGYKYGYICYLCHSMIDVSLPHTDGRSFTIDHITPLARNGTNAEDNLRPAHLACNSHKGDR